MSPLPALMTAHEDFAWDGSIGTGERRLLASPRLIHAVLVEAPGPQEPWFKNFATSSGFWHALCGRQVLAVTPEFFDETRTRTCKRCAATAARWLDNDRLIEWDWAVGR